MILGIMIDIRCDYETNINHLAVRISHYALSIMELRMELARIWFVKL